ncbi:hypothetical protein DDB_G0272164 [Dictyostelium discoideum AX4]|uniref:Uncharacterized protein n=1 Tax=Dictyostelium discoideum TaxID=44689 RepID=Q75JV0_DICDI|nr:hypothetical protein DDB_G0272164 [Dictyostelium discoideum AX4]EAL71234.1 hypothetical protein DDB_G0272164 [Dictyostelium discoideum AX4]|eukprot:XP_645239.1 hypothetical protein DDB_G0272164 [Dictyostelium discoideum AX4]
MNKLDMDACQIYDPEEFDACRCEEIYYSSSSNGDIINPQAISDLIFNAFQNLEIHNPVWAERAIEILKTVYEDTNNFLSRKNLDCGNEFKVAITNLIRCLEIRKNLTSFFDSLDDLISILQELAEVLPQDYWDFIDAIEGVLIGLFEIPD